MKLLNFFRKLLKIKTPEQIAKWEEDRNWYSAYFRVNLKFWNSLIELQDRGISLTELFSDESGNNKPSLIPRGYPYFDLSINLYFKGARIKLTKYSDEKLVKEFKLPSDCCDNDWLVTCDSYISGTELSTDNQMRLIGKIAEYIQDQIKKRSAEADQKLQELLA